MQILRVIGCLPSQWERHIFYIPPGKKQNRIHFVFLNFGVDPFNCQSFIEIVEMACSTTALGSRKHNLKNENYHPKKSFQTIKASCFPLTLESLATFSRQTTLYFNSTLPSFTFESNDRSCQFLIAKPEKNERKSLVKIKNKSLTEKAGTCLKIHKIQSWAWQRVMVCPTFNDLRSWNNFFPWFSPYPITETYS